MNKDDKEPLSWPDAAVSISMVIAIAVVVVIAILAFADKL